MAAATAGVGSPRGASCVAKEAAAALERLEERRFFQAAGAPEAVIAGEVVEAPGDELEDGDVEGFEDWRGGEQLALMDWLGMMSTATLWPRMFAGARLT